jgi:hypothetical protein
MSGIPLSIARARHVDRRSGRSRLDQEVRDRRVGLVVIEEVRR